MPDRVSDSAIAFLSRFRKITSMLAIAFGVVVLAGWAFHVELLKTFIHGQVAVKANTAVCFMLLGTALLLFLKAGPKNPALVHSLSGALATLAAFIGLLSFLEFWYGLDLGIDQLLFTAGPEDLPGSIRIGLMSPLSAASFFLLGTALVLINKKARRASLWENCLASVTAVISIFGILDFIFTPQKTHTYISPVTALVILLFSSGLLCSRTDWGLGALVIRATPGGELSRRLLPTAILIPLIIGWLRWKGEEAGLFSAWTGLVIMVLSAGTLLVAVALWTAYVLDQTDAERQKAEASARQLAAIVTASNDGMIGKTLDGIVISWNRGAERIYGYSAAEMLGQSALKLCPPENASELRDVMQRVAQGESIGQYETLRQRKDGVRIYVSLSVSAVKDENGKIIGVSTVTRDITQAKQAREALNRSESRYRSLVTATTQIVWSTNAAGEVIEDMPLWRAFTGQSLDQVLGSGWLQSVHPDDRQRTKEVWERACRDRSLYDIEYRIKRHDGEYRIASVRGVPVLENDGAVREWIGTCTDITERKEAQEKIRKAAQYARTLIEASLDPLVTIGKDGKILDVNRATENVTGYSRDQLIGSDFCSYFTEPEEARRGYQRVFAQGTVFDYPLAIRNRSGSETDVLYNATLFTNEAGDVEGVFAAARDITRTKAAEQEVRRLNNDLEARVAQRTAQLEAANKELEAFTYSVSHDLRAPLRHISGFAKILTEDFGGALPPEARHHLQRIEEGTRRMGQLVDDLLNLARVGRRELTLQVTGYQSLVEEVISSLKPEIGERRVEWRLGKLPFVECDPSLMKQVFQNLLSNAVKFTRPRDPAIIEVGQAERDGLSAVYVRDNGVGFSMKYSDKLFGVFQRLHRVEDFEGTGVGLATVQRIIQKHGGRIWAEAELDQGATFYFALGKPEPCELKTEAAKAGGQSE